MQPSTHTWHFPLPRTHTGMLLGNGVMGVMVWGEANKLCVTFNRGDFWDHRGGLRWTPEMSYACLREILEAGDDATLRERFETNHVPEGHPRKPGLLPLGRIELLFPADAVLTTGCLDYASGQVTINLELPGQAHAVAFDLAMDRPLLHITCPPELPVPDIHRVSAWDYVGDYLLSTGFTPPRFFESPDLTGWVQERPADPPLTVGYHWTGKSLRLGVAYGDDNAAARAAVCELVAGGEQDEVGSLQAANGAWWADYWSDIPQLEIPDERISFAYQYGLYKFAGLTNPAGIAAGLQGAWIEEYQMPPWRGDYHFNINVQMCYWPAYRSGRLEHLKPLFAMIESWLPQMRETARIFTGCEDGLMQPHASDDRGTCMGGYWTGEVDHGCTAWIAEMMYRYYQYSGDTDFLRATVFPFMQAALNTYRAMLEEDGEQYRLAASVSPEYDEAYLNAWGTNASFQLACIHFLCEALQDSATVLGEPPDPMWSELQNKVPRATLWGEPGEEQIAVWEGEPLRHCHRHHSHFGAIHPFDTIDPQDPDWQGIAGRTLKNWIGLGTGLWCGWSLPWASMIHTRYGNAGMAVWLLQVWDDVFTNEGHGTLFQGRFPGFTAGHSGVGMATLATVSKNREIMQMDAGMCATAAVMDLLLHTRRGVNYLFAGAPPEWERVAFRDLRTEGGFRISAERVAGSVTAIDIRGGHQSRCRIANPWTGTAVLKRNGAITNMTGNVLEIELSPNECVTLGPLPS